MGKHEYLNLLCWLVFLYNHAGIMTAKSKSITECCTHNPFLRFQESKIQAIVQCRIIRKMIYGRRNNIIDNTHYACDCFYYAGGSKAMTRHRFRGADIQFESILSEHIHDCLYF